jgi:hypothetical protein
MYPRADITGIRPVGPIETTRPTAPAGDARQEVVDRFNQASIGKLFQAQVLSRMTDGSFAVRVADTTMRMNLPVGMQVGDGLDLTLVATQPRPSFLLGNQTEGKTDASLSNAGKLINNVLQAAQKEGVPTALVGKTPIVSSPATSTTQVATALKDTLAFSGLFYESHMAQWASGERPLADLMREPQAKNSNPSLVRTLLLANASDADLESPATSSAPTQSDGTPSAAAKPEGRAGENVRENQASGRQPTELPRAMQTSAAMPPSTDASPSETAGKKGPLPDASTAVPSSANAETATRPETLSSESVRMISLQLEALEQRHVAWQGELWPGQPMEWEVTEEEPNRKSDDPEKSWQSVIRFELPSLGAVAASIRLTGNRLQVQVRTGNEDTAFLLRAHGGELASALDAAGSPLDLLTVKRDESV